MDVPIGTYIPISPGRRIICDFLDASVHLPTVAIQKTVHIPALVAARRAARPRPSWTAIFTKAYGIVVSRRPDLRRAFLSFPWERLFQYAAASADIVVESLGDDGSRLSLLPIQSPEKYSLAELDAAMSASKVDPAKQVRRFRRALVLARCPVWVRRAVWWGILNISGFKRARYFSTFGVSSIGNLGCDSLRPLSPWITLLHCGAIDAQGAVALRLSFDHRVLDGSGAALALNEMEQTLNEEILLELTALNREQRIAG